MSLDYRPLQWPQTCRHNNNIGQQFLDLQRNIGLTTAQHPPCVKSHCRQAKLPVAAASCAGLAPLFAKLFPGRPASSTRYLTHVSFPARAAWCTGEAPRRSFTSPFSTFSANCTFRVCTSPCLAARSVRSTTMTWLRVGNSLKIFNTTPYRWVYGISVLCWL